MKKIQLAAILGELKGMGLRIFQEPRETKDTDGERIMELVNEGYEALGLPGPALKE